MPKPSAKIEPPTIVIVEISRPKPAPAGIDWAGVEIADLEY